MSTGISTVYQDYFDPIVKQSYQASMKLRSAVRLKTGVVGDTCKFKKFGDGTAKPRGPIASDVPVMSNSYTEVTATLTDWTASDYTDIFSQPKVNFDEVQLQAESNAMAIGRRFDQQIIDAMNASAYATAVSIDLGGTNSSLNFEKVRKASALLNINNVPMEERYFLIHANSLYGLLGESEATSSDYATINALQSGSMPGIWMGFKWIVVGNMDEGGLPLSTNSRTNFAFHGGSRGAVGAGIGLDFKSSIDWIPQKKSWLVSTDYSGGAVTIDTDAVIKVATYEA